MHRPRLGEGPETRANAKLDSNAAAHCAKPAFPQFAQFRRERIAEQMHRLGLRALYQVLDEIAPAAWSIAEPYAHGLTPAMIAAAGANEFPPRPLHVVPR